MKRKNVAEVMLCDGVGHKKYSASSLLPLEHSLWRKPVVMSRVHLRSQLDRSMQGGTEASCQ